MLSQALKDAPPPPRRTSTVGGSVPATPLPPASAGISTVTKSAALQSTNVKAGANVNDAFYGIKAFGYATLMVTVGATASVWGVKTYMGVKDVSLHLQCAPQHLCNPFSRLKSSRSVCGTSSKRRCPVCLHDYTDHRRRKITLRHCGIHRHPPEKPL